MPKTYPETKYSGKRVSTSGPQPVFKQLLPDGSPVELSPVLSQKVYNHSPSGFQWNYGGSGPSQLALALLLDVTTDPQTALLYHHDFKWTFVASWGDEWEITSREILEWLARQQARELQKRLMASRN